MNRQILLLVITLILCVFQIHARICGNIHVNNHPDQLTKYLSGCTIVIGYLKIVLIEYHPILNHHNISFPELKEITGYLLMFRVFGLTSIGKLFPNLTVIRGDTLLLDYALVIHSLPDLKQIGLNKLLQIGNGSTRIDDCPHLCFVDTIDWQKIGGSTHDLHYFNQNRGNCRECPGNCSGFCWNEDTCQIMPTKDCNIECIGCTGPGPDDCHACKTFSDNGTCVSRCPKNKFRDPISHTCITEKECLAKKGFWWSAQEECVIGKCPPNYEKNDEVPGGCYFCGIDCKKECWTGTIDSIESAITFQGCTHIRGALEIKAATESVAKAVEDALANVREIDYYLIIYGSHGLKSLKFLNQLKVIAGKVLYNNNYSLVVFHNRNLYELWDANFTLTITSGKLLFHYNPLLCFQDIMDLVEATGLSRNTTRFDISYTNGDDIVCRRIDINLKVTNRTATSATLTWENSKSGTFVGYTVQYTEDPFGNITIYDERQQCVENGWIVVFVEDNVLDILNLIPYTQYAVYISEFTVSSQNHGSHIHHFVTLPDYPSDITDVNVVSTTSSSITVRWKPPQHPGGILTYYEIISYIQEEEADFIRQRDYCSYPFDTSSYNLDKNTPLEAWDASQCCKKQNWDEWKQGRPKRSADNNWSSNRRIIHVNANSSIYELTSLKYFRIYVMILKVCNHIQKCSTASLLFQRTQPKPGVDDIPPGISVAVNNSNVYFQWLEPTYPNSLITSYIVQYKIDGENSVPISHCIKHNDYKNGGNGYLIKNVLPGRYSIKVTAVSLAGLGNASESVYFEIKRPYYDHQENFIPIFLTSVFVVLVLMSFSVWYLYWYKNKKKNWQLLIHSDSKESFSIEDVYKLNREDIDVLCDINEGNFGRILNGYIKSQNRPCTIKVGQEFLSSKELSDFLEDAFLMKISSGCYHLVDLLGVVSEGEPALIIMELIAWGDLKSFLKLSKGKKTITYEQMYRMAAEIADGLAYLTSKGFIHRDLAVRNCLVTAGNTVKIANFGISKDVYKEDYYKDESRGLIPIRWMAPESLIDGIFTCSSNVWSYGILLAEIASFAEQPYQNLSNEEVLEYVIGERIMECPPECPDLFYEIMVACWRWVREERPFFSALLKQLQAHVQKDFKLISFYHSREGMSYRKLVKTKEYNTMAHVVQPEQRKGVHWSPSVNERETQNLPSSSDQV